MNSITKRGGVSATNYVLHIQNGVKTICGRFAAKVNCKAPVDIQRDLMEGGLQDDVCIQCRKKLEEKIKARLAAEAKKTARIHELIREIPTPCSGCHKIAHVTSEERGRGRWTCYGCGLVNKWEKK